MFNKALYYPTIDIKDENWLKTAYLFWDGIYTIVPESMEGRVYNNPTTQYLEGEGYLQPILVNPEYSAVEELVQEVKKYAKTREGMACLNQRLPDDINSNPYDDTRSEFYLHHEKLPYNIQELVADKIGDDGWARVSENFASFYMTLLANKIANQESISLITSSSPCEKLSTNVSINKNRRFFSIAHTRPESIGRCMVTKMIIDGITINPLTSMDDLRIFKEKHKTELEHFRTGLDETSHMELPPDITMEGLEEMARWIYENKVKAAYQDLKDSLKGAGIHFTIGGAAAFAFTEVSAYFNELLSILSTPVKMAIGVGAALSYQGYQTIKDAKDVKRKHQMSYLLSIDRELK